MSLSSPHDPCQPDLPAASEPWRGGGEELETFEASPLASCLLDEKGRVVRLNRAFRDYLDEHDYIQDAQPGVLISCIHAVRPGPGCGRTLSCGECVLRNAINRCVSTGVCIEKARMPFRREGSEEEAVLLISISRTLLQGQARLVLSVEDITEVERRATCVSGRT